MIERFFIGSRKSIAFVDGEWDYKIFIYLFAFPVISIQFPIWD